MPKQTRRNRNKRQSKKTVLYTVHDSDGWVTVAGELKRGPGRPNKGGPIFTVVAEKLPYAALGNCRRDMESLGYRKEGVYLAHDSFGVARYGGRGQIFTRLAKHKQRYPRELVYFSFYTIASKQHERDIETAILRAAGPSLALNTRKVRDGIDPGDVRDYEPGTEFYERQGRRGKKPATKRASKQHKGR